MSRRADARPSLGDLRTLWDRAVRRVDPVEEAVRRHLDGVQDLMLVALKGHLLIESAMTGLLRLISQRQEPIDDARLRFPQLVSLLNALVPIPAELDWLWDAINRINLLRNKFAHDIEPSDAGNRAAQIVRIVEGGAGFAVRTSGTPAERLAIAMAGILGVLNLIESAIRESRRAETTRAVFEVLERLAHTEND